MHLRIGDSRELTFAELAAAADESENASFGPFLVGDVITFTLRADYDATGRLLRKHSDDGSITFTTGSTDVAGTVHIVHTDWQNEHLTHGIPEAVWDLVVTRGAATTTLWTGHVALRPWVTR